MNPARRRELEAQERRLACAESCDMRMARIHALSIGDEVTLRCTRCGNERVERRHRGVVVA